MTRRNPVRLWLWLHAMDVLDAAGRACDKVLRRAYLFALSKASDNEDWGEPAEPLDMAVPW